MERRWVDEGEEKFRIVAAQANLGILIVQDGRIQYANSAAAALAGCPPEKMIGWDLEQWARLLTPECRERILNRSNIAQNSGQGRTCPLECKLADAEGKSRWIDVFIQPISLGDGLVDLVLSVDVTEHKKSEDRLLEVKHRLEEKITERDREIIRVLEQLQCQVTKTMLVEDHLRHSEDKYYTLFQQSSDCILIMDMAGRIIDANVRATEQLGYPLSEMVQRNIRDLCASHALESMAEASKDLARDGAIHFEIDFQTHGGAVFSGEVSASLIDVGGVPIIQQSIRECTARVQSPKIIAERERARMAENAFETLPIIVAISDPDGRMFHVNREFQDSLGWTQKEVLGNSALEIGMFDESAQKRFEETILPRLFAGDEIRRLPMRIKCKNGKAMSARMSWSMLKNTQGENASIVNVIEDLKDMENSDLEVECGF